MENKFFVVGRSVSNGSDDPFCVYMEGEDAQDAIKNFLDKYEHTVGIKNISAYKDANAYYEQKDCLASLEFGENK